MGSQRDNFKRKPNVNELISSKNQSLWENYEKPTSERKLCGRMGEMVEDRTNGGDCNLKMWEMGQAGI